MITRELAERLRDAGVPWTPGSGDRFMIPDRDLDDDIFVVSDMTIEISDALGEQLVRFNGTTEWALDSIDAQLVLWLPREDQLRGRLGSHFVSLDAVGPGFVVILTDGTRHAEVDAERAYARAVLHLVGA